MLTQRFNHLSLVVAITLIGLTAPAQDKSLPNDENGSFIVERTDVKDDGNREKRIISRSDTLPSRNGDSALTIREGEIVHVTLKGLKKFNPLIIENKTQFFGDADFIAFDEFGGVIENGSEEFGPIVHTAIWYGHLQNLRRSAEISEIYVRISLKESAYDFDGLAASEEPSAFSALTATTTTFIRPVTTDTGGYRKYDSKAVTGKFHSGDDYYNKDLKVLASNCGVVVGRYTTGNGDRGLGNTIIIRHDMTDGGNSYSLYGHLASFAANTQVGKPVSRGQRIGTMGKSGSGSNNIVHLHYEIKRSGILGNPRAFGTFSINALGLVGYVPQWGGNKYAKSATDYGYFKPSVGDYPAICK